MNAPANDTNGNPASLAKSSSILEILPGLCQSLLLLEDKPETPGLVDSARDGILAIAATARDSSASDIADLCALGEQVLDAIRCQKLIVSTPIIDTLLEACELLAALAEGGENAPSIEQSTATIGQISERLTGILNQTAAEPIMPAPAASGTPAWPSAGCALDPDLVRQFKAEGLESLQLIEANLLAFEKRPHDIECIHAMFRAVHNIKGTADYVGLAQIKTLSHRLEDVLDLARSGRCEVSASISDLIFRSVDELRAMINALEGDGEQDRDLTDLALALEKAMSTPVADSPPTEMGASPAGNDESTAYAEAAEQQLESIAACCRKIADGDSSEHVLAVLYRGTATLRGAAACLGQESLAALADELTLAVDKCRDGRRQARELCARSRSNDMVARETPFASVIETCQELLQGDSSETILTTLHRDLEGLCDTSARMRETAIAEAATTFLQSIGAFRENRQQQMRHSRSSSAARSPHDGRTPEQRGSEPIAAPGPVAAPVHASSPVAASRGERTTPSPTCAAAAKTMRVDQGKLDDYINLAGELVIARNALVHEFRQSRFDGAHHHGLKESVERVQRIVADIQANAMSMRMVPVMTVFQRFPRMVRDIAKTQDKQIEVQIFGEDTELDKQVAEKLGDPLVHLIRNSADHGIELPGARRAAGKSESGLITLRAGREGSAIVIDILDDGRGIDVSRLRAKAVEKGILRQEQADAMPREKALELIFAAGLSTAKSVSDLSGRGVGMDVVRNNITDLGGTVSVFSEENQGTQIRLQLPLTLAVTTVVLVSSHDGLYAVPMESVQETVKVAPRDIRTLNGQCAISLRGAIVPVLSLAEVLSSCTTKHIHHRQDVAPLARDRSGRVPIVVVATASTCFGIAVDELKGQQEIVIKPLPSQLGQLPGVAGATIMGDGSVVLILDPASIYALVTRGIDPGTAAVHPLARCSARTETKA